MALFRLSRPVSDAQSLRPDAAPPAPAEALHPAPLPPASPAPVWPSLQYELAPTPAALASWEMVARLTSPGVPAAPDRAVTAPPKPDLPAESDPASGPMSRVRFEWRKPVDQGRPLDDWDAFFSRRIDPLFQESDGLGFYRPKWNGGLREGILPRELPRETLWQGGGLQYRRSF